MYEYLIGSLLFFLIWAIIYFLRKDLHKEMIFASLLSMPLALSELFFVPRYWSPGVIFKINLFGSFLDFESFLFCFALGGLVASLYEFVLKKHLVNDREKRKDLKNHLYILFSILVFCMVIFSFIFGRDLIYTAILSMSISALVILFFRRDLIKETIYGGFLFLLVYSLILIFMNYILFPGWVFRAWNFEHLWGIVFLGIPLEEFLFSLSFGFFWASIYEYIRGYSVK